MHAYSVTSVVSDSLQPARLLCLWDSPGKSTGVGGHATFLQWIFPIQGSNLSLPHCRQILYYLSHQGKTDGHEQIRESCDKGKDKINSSSICWAFFIFFLNGPSRWINTYLHFLTLSSWDRGYHPHHFIERRREVGQSVQNHTVTKRNRASVWTQVIRPQNFCSLLQGAA